VQNALSAAQLAGVLEELWVDETTLYAELAERVSKEEYKAIYESMKVRQEDDGTNAFVFELVEGLIGKPANARSDWPYVADLKTVIEKKLPNVKVPQNPKRAVLIQLIALTWRNLSEALRPALTATAPAVAVAPAFLDVRREVEAVGQLSAALDDGLEQQRLQAELAQVVAARALGVGHRALVGELEHRAAAPAHRVGRGVRVALEELHLIEADTPRVRREPTSTRRSLHKAPARSFTRQRGRPSARATSCSRGCRSSECRARALARPPAPTCSS